MSLKVLLVSNFSQPRCGIAEYGRQAAKALESAGAWVHQWDGGWQAIQDRGGVYLPEDLSRYDVVHVNWHPVTINHYVPQHFDWVRLVTRPKLSVMLHDIPPFSSCPFLGLVDVVFSTEHCRVENDQLPIIFPYPCVDYAPLPKALLSGITIGYTGVRGDGRAELEALCSRRRFYFNASSPDRWLETFEEIERLSWSTLNVCWYHEERGRASAPMLCLSARRPLLLNRSPMFWDLQPYADELYFSLPSEPLEEAVDRVLSHVGGPRVPSRVLSDFSWLRAAQRMLDAWTS